MNSGGPKRQAGLTLIELMVALGLGMFLVAGLVNVFSAHKAAVRLEASLARLQENGRLALDLLAADIRGAMYMGCAGTAPEIMARDTVYTGLRGFERTASTWTPALPARLSALRTRNRIGSDVLDIQRSLPMNLSATREVTASSTSVSVSGNPARLRAGDRVTLGDCSGAHVFAIGNNPSTRGGATNFAWNSGANRSGGARPVYAAGADVLEFVEYTWYVRDTGRTRLDGDVPIYALVRGVRGSGAVEMVAGVEYLQVLYGERLGNGNMRYVPATDAALDMGRVVSLRLGLLLQSFEPVLDADDSAVYQVLDQAIGATGNSLTHNGDRTLRRVFSTTVALRNGGAGT